MKLKICNYTYTLILIAAVVASCKPNDTEEVKIHRFDIETFGYPTKSADEKQALSNKYKDVIQLYVNNIYPDSLTNETAKLDTFANSDAINFFYPETKRQFPDLNDIEKELAKEKSALSDCFSIDFPTIYSAIIPYNQSIILNGTVAIIGLNHYLGAGYKPYEYFPEYIRHFKIRDKIKYDFAEAVLKTHFEYVPKTSTLIEKMIYEGLVASASEKIVPEYTDSLYFSFTKEKYDWCVKNEKQIWEQLLIEDVLYSTSRVLQSELLEPAPFSKYLSVNSPGQACRWIGKRIVESYISHNGGSVKDLLRNNAYQQSQTFLIDSGYEGQ